MKQGLILVAVVFVLGACAGKKTIEGGGGKVTKAGVLSVWGNWIKDKGGKFDIEFAIQNESDKGLIILLADMQCSKGGASGELKHTFFNTGERTIDFTPKQTKKFRMVCKIGSDVKGEYQITINRVFTNPGNDGKTKGDVVANNIVWKAADGGK